MTKLTTSLVVFAAALAGQPATAQIPTSTRDRVTTPIPPSLEEVARTDRVFRDTVACVVRYQPDRTRRLLDTIPGTWAESTILTSFRSRLNQCFDGFRNQGRSMSFFTNLLRGVIAEIYYGREFPQGIAAASSASEEQAAAWARPRTADGSSSQAEMLHAMARCVTLRQPAEVAAMIAAEPFSVREREAIRTLHGSLSHCLDSGIELEASRQSLRALMAEAAFHYAQATRSGFAPIRTETAEDD